MNGVKPRTLPQNNPPIEQTRIAALNLESCNVYFAGLCPESAFVTAQIITNLATDPSTVPGRIVPISHSNPPNNLDVATSRSLCPFVLPPDDLVESLCTGLRPFYELMNFYSPPTPDNFEFGTRRLTVIRAFTQSNALKSVTRRTRKVVNCPNPYSPIAGHFNTGQNVPESGVGNWIGSEGQDMIVILVVGASVGIDEHRRDAGQRVPRHWYFAQPIVCEIIEVFHSGQKAHGHSLPIFSR